MSWRDAPDEDAALCQHLRRDDNVCLGLIVRYYENGPTYAWWHRAYGDITRFGARSTDQAARAAVERAIGEVGS